MRVRNVSLGIAILSFASLSAMSNMDIETSDIEVNKLNTINSITLQDAQVKTIVNQYLDLKNALVADDSKKAAQVGGLLAKTLKTVDVSKYKKEQQQELKEIIEDAVEHGEHISESEMAHQREHFKILSEDLVDMIAITGAPETLYQQYCPMYDKGSLWLSAEKEVKNPYYGSKMLTCGKVQKEFN